MSSSPKSVKSSVTDKIREQIEVFVQQDIDQELNFPYTLSSYERRKVHELAEMLHLEHRSIGEGKERRISVKKPSKDKENDTDKQLLERIQEYMDVVESDHSNVTNKATDEGMF